MSNELLKLTNGQKGEPSTFQIMVQEMPPNSKRTRKNGILNPSNINQQLSNSAIDGAIKLHNIKNTTNISNERVEENLFNILVNAALSQPSLPENSSTVVSIPVVSTNSTLSSTNSSSSLSIPIVISNILPKNNEITQNGLNISNQSEIPNISVSSDSTLTIPLSSTIKASNDSSNEDFKFLVKTIKTNAKKILKLKIRNIVLRMKLIELKIKKDREEKEKKWANFLKSFKNTPEENFKEKQKKSKDELISIFEKISKGEHEKEYTFLHTEMLKILTNYNFK